MLKDLLQKLKEGVRVQDVTILGEEFREGRISSQKYFDLKLRLGEEKKKLMQVSVYYGKVPHYKPWIELFSIHPKLIFEEKTIHFFGSDIETFILNTFSDSLGDGGRIFIEYQHDKSTRERLSVGIPEPCTRLGYELFKRDFTWFKDWYFAEGFYEGGQKLQAEKAIDEEHRRKHLKRIEKEVTDLLEKDELEEKLEERAYKVLDKIEK
ncbi:MAG: DUF1122 family protein [Candidatus Thermoplasmatota archaeon]|nr:DUF1122 family protein [Candidatus Thermoplasmatota archaeon]